MLLRDVFIYVYEYVYTYILYLYVHIYIYICIGVNVYMYRCTYTYIDGSDNFEHHNRRNTKLPIACIYIYRYNVYIFIYNAFLTCSVWLVLSMYLLRVKVFEFYSAVHLPVLWSDHIVSFSHLACSIRIHH